MLPLQYVIRDPDGGVSLWKPGSNYSFTLTPVEAGKRRVLPGGAVVQDAWDGSVRDVKVEVLEDGRARPMTDAEREQDAFRASVGVPWRWRRAAAGVCRGWRGDPRACSLPAQPPQPAGHM